MLSLVTLTGADSGTDPELMFDLQRRYPFLEWGILYHASKEGGRYPGREWLASFCERVRKQAKRPRLALHLCGEEANRALAQGVPFLSARDLALFGRIQMNINGQTAGWGAERVMEACRHYPEKTIITQHNQNNQVLSFAVTAPNHAILFDASGGRGTEREEWPLPLEGKWCGYAGGLSADNLEEKHLDAIAHASDKTFYWIDMESSLRNVQDRFSIAKCDEVARVVTEWILRGLYPH